MKKCIDCAYFLNCEKANEEGACEKYRYIRKNIEIKEGIENLIAEKNKEREIADLFYKICPNVPPQILASAVRETIDNFKRLNNLYNTKTKEERIVIDYKNDHAIDSLKYAIEGMLSKNTIIVKPETATEIKSMQEYESHIPKIE